MTGKPSLSSHPISGSPVDLPPKGSIHVASLYIVPQGGEWNGPHWWFTASLVIPWLSLQIWPMLLSLVVDEQRPLKIFHIIFFRTCDYVWTCYLIHGKKGLYRYGCVGPRDGEIILDYPCGSIPVMWVIKSQELFLVVIGGRGN